MPMPSPNELPYDDWFPVERKRPADDTFEIGLVLAGAVSAGAYTAGVLDFLFEALDRWYEAKLEEEEKGLEGEDRCVPHHKVKLRIMTGASAGGINGAISAVALRYQYPHAWSNEKQEWMWCETGVKLGKEERDDAFRKLASDRSENPFYSTWVERIGIEDLLALGDLKTGLHSLLDCSVLDTIVRETLDFRSDKRCRAGVRDWLSDPLPLILTVTNLRGVPYQVIFNPDKPKAHQMSLHRDQMYFSVEGLGPKGGFPLSPNFMPLVEGGPEADWRALGEAALATAAFPIGLRARVLSRTAEHYNWRHPLGRATGERFEAERHLDTPSWPDGQPPEDYGFLSVDGGVMNNEPFEAARRALAGLEGKNPREGDKAYRAVVMVDPFVEPGSEGPAEDEPLRKVVFSLFGAMKNQSRFSERDRLLISREDVYSRYLVSPSRQNMEGAQAIASGGLGAFLGFFSKEYRHHDFMLGRRNCQRFLQSSFTLPESNPLFSGGRWSAAADRKYRDVHDPTHRQVIPCVGPCSIEEPLPKWPVERNVMNERLARLVDGRVDGVVSSAFASALDVVAPRKGLVAKAKRAAVGGYLWPLALVTRKQLKLIASEKIQTATDDVVKRGEHFGPPNG